MDPKLMEVGSLWLDIKGEMYFVPLGDDQYMCWYVDGKDIAERNYDTKRGKILFENLDDVFWKIQRPERFKRIA